MSDLDICDKYRQKANALLLEGLVFIVILQSGQSVMVDVATGAGSSTREMVSLSHQLPGPHLNTCIKTVFPRYGDSHAKDKTVARPSYL